MAIDVAANVGTRGSGNDGPPEVEEFDVVATVDELEEVMLVAELDEGTAVDELDEGTAVDELDEAMAEEVEFVVVEEVVVSSRLPLPLTPVYVLP
jgi:hypothetical protein